MADPMVLIPQIVQKFNDNILLINADLGQALSTVSEILSCSTNYLPQDLTDSSTMILLRQK